MSERKSCENCKYYEEDKFGSFYCRLHKTHFYIKTPCLRYEKRIA